MSQRKLLLVVVSCLLAVVVAEILGTPRNAGPDEPAHIIRGAGLVRGEVFGEQLLDWSEDHGGDVPDLGAAEVSDPDPGDDVLRVFDVPRWVTQPSEECYRQQPDVPAGCSTVIDVTGAGAVSTAGSYPVWGHVLPGVATAVIPGPESLWLARLLHAAIPILLIAATLARLLGEDRRVAASAVLLATTPMVLFMIAVVNPSGIVLAGAIALWVGADDLFRTGRQTSWLLPASFVALVVPRDDGLLWAALLLAVLMVVWRRNPMALWGALPRPTQVIAVTASVVGAGWAVLAGGDLLPVGRTTTGFEFAEEIIARSGRHLREAVGVLGWLDTNIPETTFALWCFAAGLVAMVVLVLDQRRRFAAAALALALFFVSGWVLEIIQGRTAGLFWQGRYALPMLIGVVLVAGLADGADLRIGRLAAFAPGVLALAVWNLAFLQQLRRWGVGASGSIRPWKWDTWDAPLPVLLLAAVHIAGTVGIGWLWWTYVPDRGRRLAAT